MLTGGCMKDLNGELSFVGMGGWDLPPFDQYFYPMRPKKGFRKLEYYCQFFDFIEVNSTFYNSSLTPRHSIQWLRDVRGNKTFQFSVKLFHKFTHTHNASKTDFLNVMRMLDPLAQEGKLVGILIQFPVSFKNTDDRRMYLMKLSQLFRYHQLFVEVRHDSWISPSMCNFFQENHLHPVNVDLPPLPRHMPLTQESWGDMSYFRLMGRNSETWYNPNLGERYSYFYSDSELFYFLKLIKHTKRESSKTCVVFHNDPNAFSLVNGFQLKHHLRRRQRVLVPHTLVEAHPSLKPICSRVNTQHPLFAE